MTKKKKGWRRWVKRVLLLLLAAVIALLGWNYLAPLVTADTVPVYESHTAETGSVSTVKSFSATMSVRNSELFQNGSDEVSVSDVYVAADQEVKKGDKLYRLSTGDVYTANFDGVVNALYASAGTWLRRRQPIVQVCDLTHLQVSMPVDEYDVEQVKVGMACTVTVISLGVEFETEIARVNRVSTSMMGVSSYTAEAYLTVPENILPGMACSVSIPDQTAENVVTLDMAGLSFHEDGSAYVLVKQTDGSYAEQAVETGLSDGMKVEITSGLSAGDETWVQTGTESAGETLSLSELYKRVFGATVVINDKSSQSGGRGGQGGGAMPEGMTLPEGMELPDGATLPEGVELPDGATLPEGVELPDGATLPEGANAPEASASPDESASPESTASPEATDAGERPTGERPSGTGERPARTEEQTTTTTGGDGE